MKTTHFAWIYNVISALIAITSIGLGVWSMATYYRYAIYAYSTDACDASTVVQLLLCSGAIFFTNGIIDGALFLIFMAARAFDGALVQRFNSICGACLRIFALLLALVHLSIFAALSVKLFASDCSTGSYKIYHAIRYSIVVAWCVIVVRPSLYCCCCFGSFVESRLHEQQETQATLMKQYDTVASKDDEDELETKPLKATVEESTVEEQQPTPATTV